MTYWDAAAENNGACHSIWDLLKYGNGQCAAWAQFFQACLMIQGIDAPKVSIKPSSSVTIDEVEDFIEATTEFAGKSHYIPSLPLTYFLVREWTIPPNNAVLLKPPPGADPFQGVDAAEQTAIGDPGIRAQGGENGGYGTKDIKDPRSIFLSHAINQVNGTYYDPSYGSDEKSFFGDWEDQSVDAVIGTIFLIYGGSGPNYTSDYYFWVKEANTLNTIQLSVN